MQYGAIWDNKTFNDLSENFDMNKNELLIMREKVGVEKSRFNIVCWASGSFACFNVQPKTVFTGYH